ncbi:MAG TPA: S9 family peptidase [Candidatus Aminicenantes bacterium]|mgnify:CR=1 FL=1|nr:S9 family peptidase [Candidatus Aminicenantes bacterium]
MTAKRMVVIMVAVLLFVSLAWGLQAEVKADKQPLTAETLWKIQRLGAPDISPDGKRAVVPVTTYDAKNGEASTDLWLVPTTPGKATPLTTHAASDSSPTWSPDGKWIAFESKRGDDEATQVYVISTSGGEARRLTNLPTGAFAARWFPDSRRLAFISRVWTDLDNWDAMAERIKEHKESKVSAKTWDTVPISYWDHWLDDRQAHIYTIALEGGDPAPVTLETGYQLSRSGPGKGSYDISPDGEEIAFAADIDTTGVESNYDIFAVPAKGGDATNITTDNPASDTGPQYSPDGKWLAFRRQLVRGFYGDTLRLVLHDRETGVNKMVTNNWDRSVGTLAWSPDGKRAYASIDDAGHHRVYRVDLPNGESTPLTREHSFDSLALDAKGRVLIALRQGFSEPPTLVRIDTRKGTPLKLSGFNDEVLKTVDWGRYESVTYKGANNQEIQMWVIYPPGFDPAKKWPLYLLLHGGPHNGIYDSFHWRWNAQVFSGWGYVTAWHNFHGSSGFGQAFADSINPDQSQLPYQDTIKASEYFQEKEWIDAERMAAGGGSFGGYLASVLLGRDHPFKTLVAHAAVYNWYTQYAADYGAEKRRFGAFWQKKATHFKTSSPHFGAANFNTPTLVIHGLLDRRVPLNHGIELFHTLQNRGVRSRFIYYPDENHWVLKLHNSLHWYHAKKEWLQEFIGTGPN